MDKILFDTHVHSTFSHDGRSDVEDYIRLIDEGKVRTLGFSEHLDFMPECGGYGLFDYEGYYGCIRSYRQKGYDVYAGAEIDYASDVEAEITETLKNQYYDYTICSVHMIDGISISDRKSVENLTGMRNMQDVLEKYYNEVGLSLKVRQFDVIGHIGIYKRYFSREYFGTGSLSARIIDMEKQLAADCALSGKIIEVNSSGLLSPYTSILPDAGFLKEYYKRGGRRVSLGSDAHHVSCVGGGFGKAAEVLREIGFKYVFLPWNSEKAFPI